MAAVSISQELLGNCRDSFYRALPYVLTNNGVRFGVNGYAPHLLPAYISAVASIEAFVNESLLSPMTLLPLKDSPFRKLGTDWLDKIDLRQKVLVIPELLFGWTFDSSAQPYQDFCLLVKVRNDLTHYAFSQTNPRYVRSLKERGIFLYHDLERNSKIENPWAQDASCTEGIRWAHNVVCDIATKIIENAKDSASIAWNLANFTRIPDTYVPNFLRTNGIDPTSNFPNTATPLP